MASSLVGQHQITTFTTPVNGTTPIDANQVRGNDNTIKTSYDAHDSDGTIHFQDSTLAARPAASTVGLKWMTNDGYRIYYDDGAAWHEAAYLSTAAGGTVVGDLTINPGSLIVGADPGGGQAVRVAGAIHSTGAIIAGTNAGTNSTFESGINLTGTPGAPAQGDLYKDSSDGTVIYCNAGAANDFKILASGAGVVMTVPTGAIHAVFGGNVTAARLITNTDITSATAFSVASDGHYTSSPDAVITAVKTQVVSCQNTSASGTVINHKTQITQTVATSGSIYASHNVAQTSHTSGTITTLIGLDGIVYANGSGGTTTDAISIMAQSVVAAGATVTTLTGVQVRTGNGITGTATTAVGVDVLAISAGGTNYAIRTSTGAVSFGDVVELTAAATARSGSIVGLGGTTQTTIGANGAATALTANPLGYLIAYKGSTKIIIPYYNA